MRPLLVLLATLSLTLILLSTTSAFVTKGFYGSTGASGTSWQPPSYSTETVCTPRNNSQYYGYHSFQVTFDASNSSMWLVTASADNTLGIFFVLSLYTSFDPLKPCDNLYQGGLIDDVDGGLLTMIKKPVFFEPGTYTFVATAGYPTLNGDFAVMLMSVDGYTTVNNASRTWQPFYNNGDPCFGYRDQASYASYEFTVPLSGYYDVSSIALPDPQYVDNWLQTGMAIYNDTLQNINNVSVTCNQNFVYGISYSTTVAYFSYLYLQQGVTYTVVVSAIQEQVYGQVGFQVTPTRIVFWQSDPVFYPPIEGYCTNVGVKAAWGSTPITVTSQFTMFALMGAATYAGYPGVQINVYSGLNLGNATVPPNTCTNLIAQGSSVGLRSLTVGGQYSVVLYTIQPSSGTYASLLWLLPGDNLNIPPPSNPQTSGSASTTLSSGTPSTGSSSTHHPTTGTSTTTSTSNNTSPAGDAGKLCSSTLSLLLVILFLWF
eukprot:TRINITY_DN913_c0_g1_i1.p1 TRINITY_DN913_c0_g1~~TRINITY_DN913_c0_g1_i1.p1  ORF type:complete len:487 (-),score=67.19 TRINITY_DN913_c0_g1_i1:337-1797(-)